MAKIVSVCAAALIDIDGRVLLAKRPDHKADGGLWEFPGGKIDADETPENALVRELNEELGIETQQSCLAPFSFASKDLSEFHLLILLFLCRKWDGLPSPKEGQTLKWVSPAQLLNFDLVPADRPLAAQLRDYLCLS